MNVSSDTPAALLQRLEDAGAPVASIWDFVGGFSLASGDAIPILVDWLANLDSWYDGPDRLKLREGIIRALSQSKARSLALPVFLELFRQFDDVTAPTIRWTLGNAIYSVANSEDFEDLANLALDRSFGRDREMIVLKLGKIRDPRAVPVLRELLDDSDVIAQAVYALGQYREPADRKVFHALQAHPHSLVRRAAKAALRKFDKDHG